ncbi:MAG: hypothetical protein C4310_02735 [Chloroflexota bacterium]
MDPEDALVLDELGRSYLAVVGDVNQAIAYLEQAAQLEPDNPRILGHLGIAYYRRLRFEDAQPVLEKAIALGDTGLDTLFSLGLTYYYLDQCDKAIPIFEQVLAQAPNDPTARANLRDCQTRPPPRPTTTPRP